MDDSTPDYYRRRPLRRMLQNWLQRHQDPFNRGIHLIGIPLAMLGVVLFLAWPWDDWYWGALTFCAGYALQWLGHLVEGNDLGEWAGIKRLLGLPYVAISPRWQQSPQNPPYDGSDPVR